MGFRAGQVLAGTTGGNTFLGAYAGLEASTASNDIFIGLSAGTNIGTGSSDIYIGNSGQSTTESNVIRIGTQGTGAGEQNATYIAGINGNTVSSGSPVFVDSNGMLGVGASGNSGVTSFNGRTGAVVPASGDYSFSLPSGTLESSQFSGTYSSAVTLSNASNSFTGNGAGLTNVPVSAGSPNYIQNGTSQPTGASFNIDGSGTVGGTLTGITAVNTSGTYQIGSSTILTGSSSNLSLMVGFSAAPNNTAAQNTFVGVNAGLNTTAGSETTAVGYDAGPLSNGGSSVFVGSFAGEILNTGSENTLAGEGAGEGVQNGSQNTFIGTLAGEGQAPRTSPNVGNTYVGYAAGSDIEQGSYSSQHEPAS